MANIVPLPPPDELRETLSQIYPELWQRLTVIGRRSFVADYRAAKRQGELAAAQVAVDWLMTLAFIKESGFLENAGRPLEPDERIDDLDEFIASR